MCSCKIISWMALEGYPSSSRRTFLIYDELFIGILQMLQTLVICDVITCKQ